MAGPRFNSVVSRLEKAKKLLEKKCHINIVNHW